MQVGQYQKIYHWFTARPRALGALRLLYRGLPLVVFGLYGVLLLCHAWWVLGAFASKQAAAPALQAGLAAVLVPAVVFVLGSVVRRCINAPRPYEQEGFVPLVSKNKKGHAFPSRHVLSVAVIALAWWVTAPAVGVLLALLTVCIAALRVIAGVHHLRDVVAGAIFGGGLGAALFLLWSLRFVC